MDRRTFLASAGALAIAGSARAETSAQPYYRTTNVRWQAAYDTALTVLDGNVQLMPRYSKPVLIEGAAYQGIWLECGPHEASVYRRFRPDVARQSHLSLFELQRADGQLPCNNKVTETGFGQIQMVVPIAATAWEIARATGDDELLRAAYAGCSMWDDWLMRHRNSRGTGMVEGFCTYDTGHDNSPRWAGIPPQCPNKDAKLYPPGLGLPRLCPDLSATTYGGRIALSAMAAALGKTSEADRWADKAESLRKLILDKLYVADEAAFYDLDAGNAFVRVRSDVLSRVCGEHVVDQTLFDDLWTRQIHNPQAFWANYPLTSVALDDPQFVGSIPNNSWGGAAQALTALRAGRWFDHYGRPAAFGQMMTQWCNALITDGTFRQQMDPRTGVFTAEGPPGYSPAALVLMDYTWRLAGVRDDGDGLHWNIDPRHPAAQGAIFRLTTDAGKVAEIAYDGRGAGLTLAGKPIGRIDGTVRLVTTTDGRPQNLVGIHEQTQFATLHLTGRPAKKFRLTPNQSIALT